ncbi:DUF3305 domain-containing protein [uncultured Roseibium sp.]|uniref:DUF3305 domain-containing protein n=1 Tax=uncultured Roseibium sp. TaxID=1936171 RepID=UPI003747FDF9
MEREISASVGIIVERRDSTSRWVDHVWTAPAVVPDAPPTDGWQLLQQVRRHCPISLCAGTVDPSSQAGRGL